MKSKNKRLAILIVAVAIIAGVLACGDGGRVGQVTPTPTKTPKPTFTATPLPTDTPIPTNTPLPTDTPIPATNTPVILTATFTPPPTDTPTPIPPTATTKPTAKPTSKPADVDQDAGPGADEHAQAGVRARRCPAPHARQNNCGSTGIKGTVYSRTNAKLAGVSVAVWTGSWGAVSNPSNANGGWDLLLDVGPKPGNWNVRAVDAATCAKNADGNPTWPCTGFRSDEVSVATTATCEGAGAVNWAVVDFKQN